MLFHYHPESIPKLNPAVVTIQFMGLERPIVLWQSISLAPLGMALEGEKQEGNQIQSWNGHAPEGHHQIVSDFMAPGRAVSGIPAVNPQRWSPSALSLCNGAIFVYCLGLDKL